MARSAARARQGPRLLLLERGLALLRGGLTAGEAARVTGWTALDETALVRELARLPGGSVPAGVTGVEIIGVLALEPRRRCR